MGKTLQTWVEVILLVSVFVIILTGAVLIPMNSRFGQNNSIALTGNISEYQALQEQMTEKIEEGKPTFLGELGVAISTSWDMMRMAGRVIWSFISGSWIKVIVVDYLKMPYILGLGLQILFFISIFFLLLSVIFRRDTT